MAFALYEAAPAPETILARGALNVLAKFAPLVVGVVFVWSAIKFVMAGGPGLLAEVVSFLRNFALGGLLLATLIKLLGDPIAQGLRAEPLATATGVATLFLLALMTDRVYQRGKSSSVEALFQPGPSVEAVPRGALPSERDVQVMAVHEAAHVLVWGGHPGYPPQRLRLNPSGHPAGTVTVAASHRLADRTELERHMLCSLAGVAAETQVFGTTFAGSHQDLVQHAALARQFLAAAPERPGLIHDASTPEELAFNEQMIRGLRLDHLEMLAGFFTAHRDLLDELAALARVKGQLEQEDLKPFLDRVTAPLPSMKSEEVCASSA
ncbi:hypothetical protein [Deinococcus multiflagellatus]|uniref:Peptidase M41 domain-containing protein n=1 Tax=Deinococcus multiflagellatus TaxID=1656887 RepID=A0ABW1ZPB1_9DEIO|nr:hypothetical protein [Deinococcus multiflagellatus]MBZ9714934.1 hypothetical protein [Deinococcus multiflagellatus]